MSEKEEMNMREGLWVKQSELADLNNLSLDEMDLRLSMMLSIGSVFVRPQRDAERLVMLASFDHAFGKSADLEKLLGLRGLSAAIDIERARAAYDADMAGLILRERRKTLLTRQQFETLISEASNDIASLIANIEQHAEALADAVARGGVDGARLFLEHIAEELAAAISERGRDRIDQAHSMAEREH